jgi:hypothetical protein
LFVWWGHRPVLVTRDSFGLPVDSVMYTAIFGHSPAGSLITCKKALQLLGMKAREDNTDLHIFTASSYNLNVQSIFT